MWTYFNQEFNYISDSVFPRVQKVDSDTNVMLANSNDYYVFQGDRIKIYCYCTDSE